MYIYPIFLYGITNVGAIFIAVLCKRDAIVAVEYAVTGDPVPCILLSLSQDLLELVWRGHVDLDILVGVCDRRDPTTCQ